MVQEAKSLGVDTVIVGTSQSFHAIRSSASVAKHCAKKLPKCVSVVAVDNGKIAFHREASTGMSSDQGFCFTYPLFLCSFHKGHCCFQFLSGCTYIYCLHCMFIFGEDEVS